MAAITATDPLSISLRLLELTCAMTNGPSAGGDLPARVRRIMARLDQSGIRWALVGAGAVNYYSGKPRSSLDVDLLIDGPRLDQAVAIAKGVLGPRAGETRHETHVTLRAARSPLVIDLIRGNQHPLFEEALRRRRRRGVVRIPTVEALLALKYLSAVSPHRPTADKRQDILDFARTLQASRGRVDVPQLIELGAMAHDRARGEIAQLVDDVLHDRPLTI
jgi:hypothetical protein